MNDKSNIIPNKCICKKKEYRKIYVEHKKYQDEDMIFVKKKKEKSTIDSVILFPTIHFRN